MTSKSNLEDLFHKNRISTFKFVLDLFKDHYEELNIDNKKLYSLKKSLDNKFTYKEIKILIDMIIKSIDLKINILDTKQINLIALSIIPKIFLKSVVRFYARKNLIDKNYNEILGYPDSCISFLTPYYFRTKKLYNFLVKFNVDKNNIINIIVDSCGHGIKLQIENEKDKHLIIDLHNTIRNLVHTIAVTNNLIIFKLEEDKL